MTEYLIPSGYGEAEMVEKPIFSSRDTGVRNTPRQLITIPVDSCSRHIPARMTQALWIFFPNSVILLSPCRAIVTAKRRNAAERSAE